MSDPTRDYKKEYAEYHSTPEAKRDRARRNLWNRRLKGKVPPGKEIDHCVPLARGGSNDMSNIRFRDISENRGHGMSKRSSALTSKTASVEYRGHTFPGYNQPIEAPDGDTHKMMVLAKRGGDVKLVRFGHRGYQHNYSPEAKANYLKRSAGIRDGKGNLTKDDPFSPNYWARKHLWPRNQEADGTALKKKASMNTRMWVAQSMGIAKLASADKPHDAVEVNGKYYRPKVQTFMYDKRGRVLASRSQASGSGLRAYDNYKFPGGGIEPNEDVLDAARKELLEEAGYEPGGDMYEFGERTPVDWDPKFREQAAKKGRGGYHGQYEYYVAGPLGKRDQSRLGSEGDAMTGLELVERAKLRKALTRTANDPSNEYAYFDKQKLVALDALEQELARREKTAAWVTSSLMHNKTAGIAPVALAPAAQRVTRVATASRPIGQLTGSGGRVGSAGVRQGAASASAFEQHLPAVPYDDIIPSTLPPTPPTAQSALSAAPPPAPPTAQSALSAAPPPAPLTAQSALSAAPPPAPPTAQSALSAAPVGGAPATRWDRLKARVAGLGYRVHASPYTQRAMSHFTENPDDLMQLRDFVWDAFTKLSSAEKTAAWVKASLVSEQR